MSRGDERAVVEGFAAWLTSQGWAVRFEENWWDICAYHGDQYMYVEAKGETSSPGLDVDTAYGQLVRRMPAEDDPSATYALVVDRRRRTEFGLGVVTVDEGAVVAVRCVSI